MESPAIVGPNGSGKSNVADAVRWVLGEQKCEAAAWRKHAGCHFFWNRDRVSRLGYAAVAITLDNSDHQAGRSPMMK